MEQIKSKWLSLSWTVRFFCIIILHFFINIITAIIFILDDFSLANQIVHSVIHLSFFALLLKLIYIPEKENYNSKKMEKWWVLGFIVLNLIPFSQGFEPPKINVFVPMWEILTQIKLGLPFTYIHFFNFKEDVMHFEPQKQLNNPLLHINILFLNLYFCGVVTILTLTIKKKIFNK